MSFYEKTEKESTLQSDILDLMTVRGWFCSKVEFKSRRGSPDVVGMRKGRTVWIEVKREGEEAKRQQEHVARLMRAQGAEVHCVDTIEEARVIVK